MGEAHAHGHRLRARVAVIAGDGIGQEVMPEGLRVLEAASRRFGLALDLLHKVITQTRADLGSAYTPPPSAPVIELFVEKLGRLGKKSGQGFYDYTDAGRRLWPGLAEHFPRAASQPDVAAVKQRLLHIQAVEAVRCLAEGVVANTTDGNVASLLGWGFPPWAGGVFAYIDTVGVDRFVADCEALAARVGPRFAPPELLQQLAGTSRKLRDAR